MTVEQFLLTVPECDREKMAEFLYSRVPYRFIPRDTAVENTPQPLPEPSSLSRDHLA
jgi:hypothetical protein